MLQVPVQKRSIVLPILAAVLAAGIFAADTATNLDIAVPVLYVAVVLISVQFCERRGGLGLALCCIALTFFSGVLTGTDIKETGLINTAISILAIGLTTFLALKIESAGFTAKTLTEADQLRRSEE